MSDAQKIDLLAEIDLFLDETGMGASYFGKMAAGNSEIVARLRAGGRVWPETADRVRAFIEQSRRVRAAEAASEAAE